MSEYIEREKAIDALTERNLVVHMDSVNDGLVASCHRSAQRIIANLPAADVRPVVRGFNVSKDYPSLFECSVCGWSDDDTTTGDTRTYNFCPNCGAMMEES